MLRERPQLARNPTWIGVVAAALSDEEGRWLMHLRPSGKAHAGLWEFPGGKLEPGETPANALLREIEEELGIVLDRVAVRPAHFAETASEDGPPAIVILLYTCHRWSGVPRALQGEQIGWFTPGEIAALPRPPLDIALCGQLFGSDV